MISVVIPAFNEAATIAAVVQSILAKQNESTFRNAEVIVIDDGSTDQTAEEAKRAGAKVIRHPQNAGYGRSLKDGILSSSNDTIVICDADSTYPVDQIPLIFKEYQDGFDMVVGARQGKHYHGSIVKKLFRLILKYLVEFSAGQKIPDINSGLRIFSKATIIPFLSKLCGTFSFTTSLTLAYMMTGKYVKYVKINYYNRAGKSKVKYFRDSLRTMQFIIEAILFYNPIKIFILLSVSMLVLSSIGFSLSMIFHILLGYILGIASLLMSILMFGMGLLAVLLKQILNKNNSGVN